MLSPRPWVYAVFAALALPAAALEWKAQTVAVTTAPFQDTQEAVFAFKNTGAGPVTILAVQTTCDCVAAAADRKVYAPGAAGAIRATFTVGDRLGLYERTITVVTDEPDSPARLVMRIEVPEITSLVPRSVAWKLNAPADEATIELQALAGLAIAFTEVQCTTTAFSVRLETVEAGRHYRLYLRPGSTARPANAAIRIFGREKSGHDVVVSAYANVR